MIQFEELPIAQYSIKSQELALTGIINRDSIMMRNRWFPRSRAAESAKVDLRNMAKRLFMLTTFLDVSRI